MLSQRARRYISTENFFLISYYLSGGIDFHEMYLEIIYVHVCTYPHKHTILEVLMYILHTAIPKLLDLKNTFTTKNFFSPA